jgi:acid stress-induced BolA-like protein IbaG/YrbA
MEMVTLLLVMKLLFITNKTRCTNHQINLPLNGMMKDQIHALSIKTFTEDQWKEFNKGDNLE